MELNNRLQIGDVSNNGQVEIVDEDRLCYYGFCIILSVIITSVHYVIMASASFCLSFWLLSLMSLRLLFPCYFVFYILCPLCLPFILSGLEGLLCKVFLRTY